MKREKKYYGYLEGWLSIVVNTLLFILKLYAGIASKSIAVIADAWHTLSDSLTSIVVIVGFKLSSKPADKEHPFGHGMIENISSVVIATMLGIVGFSFIVDSIKKLISRESFEFNFFVGFVVVLSIVVKEALAQFSFYLGKKINSQALKADGWHHRSDAITSVIVFVGLLLGRYFWWIDGVLGLIVAIVIIYSAFEIVLSSSKMIIGESLSDEDSKKIISLVKTVSKDIEEVHHLHCHQYGDHKELTLHIRLPNKMSVEDSHSLTQKIESLLFKELAMIVTVHVEPKNKV
ncbi:MAG: cation diffusion facilitator family transporter [Brevinematales bacterium]|nr:cation diffusion facilitator family transporter [Brevinematales bacterium]